MWEDFQLNSLQMSPKKHSGVEIWNWGVGFLVSEELEIRFLEIEKKVLASSRVCLKTQRS